ncbi:hypothetical protein DPMN_171952 [Dreissena polymorpha]|uniref:Uncharacterized protein n=1 Tax=Dreissena polymorpha TaxID=45954 RepID=A0A9D4IE76_DREPO|nr:hypothetical protein DPMN_171952 [Dreissena polymorpha]
MYPSCIPTWLSAKTLHNIETKKKKKLGPTLHFIETKKKNEIGPTAVEQEQKQQKHKKSTQKPNRNVKRLY